MLGFLGIYKFLLASLAKRLKREEGVENLTGGCPDNAARLLPALQLASRMSLLLQKLDGAMKMATTEEIAITEETVTPLKLPSPDMQLSARC